MSKTQKIEPEVMWALWMPHAGFSTQLFLRRRDAIIQTEKEIQQKWSELRAAGYRVVMVIITPFSWSVMEAAQTNAG